MAINQQQLAVKKRELTGELTRILGAVKPMDKKEFDVVRLLIEQICDPRTPTFKLDLMSAITVFYNDGLFQKIPASETAAYSKLDENVRRLLMEMGYRADIETCQEHKIMGSTQDAKYAQNPHTPVGILKGKLSVEETGQARLLRMASAAWDSYYGSGSHCMISVSLEPLDKDGITLRDPRPIDMKKLAEAYPRFKAGTITFGQLLDECAMPGLQRIPAFPFMRTSV